VQSDYEFFPFSPERNDLSLDYSSVTNLNAVITPRPVDRRHAQRAATAARRLAHASGWHRRAAALGREPELHVRALVQWAVTRGMSLKLLPEYLATDRTGTSNGVETPTRTTRRLSLSGGANLDIALGSRGHLLGDISRQFSDDRSTTYRAGVPQPSPLAEQGLLVGSPRPDLGPVIMTRAPPPLPPPRDARRSTAAAAAARGLHEPVRARRTRASERRRRAGELRLDRRAARHDPRAAIETRSTNGADAYIHAFAESTTTSQRAFRAFHDPGAKATWLIGSVGQPAPEPWHTACSSAGLHSELSRIRRNNAYVFNWAPDQLSRKTK
jgi:hypothetical protein